jgi:hypothetical protein
MLPSLPEIRLVTNDYQGNAAGENRYSGIASYKTILLKTPCPGRNLPEDPCCFDLPDMTGLANQSSIRDGAAIDAEASIKGS